MDRDRVVDARRNALPRQVVPERVAFAAAHDELVVDVVATSTRWLGKAHRRSLEGLAQRLRSRPPPNVPRIDVAKLQAQDRGLDRVEPAGRTHDAMVVARALAMR